jgi:hypothetical protein
MTYVKEEMETEYAWVMHSSEVAQQTLYPTYSSWCISAQVFPASGYKGFRL